MKRNLEDKVVWIAGGGSGIGQHAAVTLSKLGMKVMIQYSNVRHAITSCCSFTCDPEGDKLMK